MAKTIPKKWLKGLVLAAVAGALFGFWAWRLDGLIVGASSATAMILAAHWLLEAGDISEAKVAVIVGLFAIAGDRWHHHDDAIALQTGVASDLSTLVTTLIDLEAQEGPPGAKDTAGTDGFLARLKSGAMPIDQVKPPDPQYFFQSRENYFDLYDAVAAKLGDLEPDAVDPVNRFYTELKLVRDLIRNLALVQFVPKDKQEVELDLRMAEIGTAYVKTICDGVTSLEKLGRDVKHTEKLQLVDPSLNAALQQYTSLVKNIKVIGGKTPFCPVLGASTILTAH